jgi:hypothetical protein
MGFAQKLGQFVGGVAGGLPSGMRAGLSIGAAGRQNDANRRAEAAFDVTARTKVLNEAIDLADSGDPEGAARLARSHGYPDMAEQMLARPGNQQRLTGDAAAATLGGIVGGAAANVGKSLDLTTASGIQGGISEIDLAQQKIGAGEGAVNALAGTPPAEPSIDFNLRTNAGLGIPGVTETAPLGASQPQAMALLGASLQQGQLDAKKAGLTPFLQSLQGLEAFAGPAGRASQYETMENQLREIGQDESSVQATMKVIKKAQQTLRDTGFLSLVQSGVRAEALKAFLIDNDLSPGMQTLGEAIISGVEFAEGQEQTKEQRLAISFSTSILQQLKYIKNPEEAEAGYESALGALTKVYGATSAQRIVEAHKAVRAEVLAGDMRAVQTRVENLGIDDYDDAGNRLGYMAAFYGVPGDWTDPKVKPSVEQIAELTRRMQVRAGNIPDAQAGEASEAEIKQGAANLDILLRGTKIDRDEAMRQFDGPGLSESERNRTATALSVLGWFMNQHTQEFDLVPKAGASESSTRPRGPAAARLSDFLPTIQPNLNPASTTIDDTGQQPSGFSPNPSLDAANIVQGGAQK